MEGHSATRSVINQPAPTSSLAAIQPLSSMPGVLYIEPHGETANPKTPLHPGDSQGIKSDAGMTLTQRVLLLILD